MDINSLPDQRYHSPHQSEVYVPDLNVSLAVVILCITGPFWLIIKMVKRLIRKSILLVGRAVQGTKVSAG